LVVGALRAVTAARLEMLWNALTKGSTRTSRASAAVVATVGLILLVLSFYLSSVFGSQAGDALAVDTNLENDESLSMVWLATFHALLVFGMGGAAGLRQRLGFDRELLRVLPLRTSQLLLAELPFGLLDTIPMLGLALFGGLGFGLMSSQLTAAPLVMLVAGLGVLSVLLMRQLVGVMTRLGGRSRLFSLLVAITAVPLAVLALVAAGRGLTQAAFVVLDWMPTTMGYHAIWAWARGEPGASAGFLLASVGFVLVLFVLTTWLQVREMDQDPPRRAARGGTERLWSFRSPSTGLARIFVHQVFGARYGKLLTILPLFVTAGFVLVAVKIEYVAGGSVLHQLFEQAQTYALYAFVPPLVVLLAGGFWMNQFAWDGPGVRMLLAAPVRTTEILDGKMLGLVAVLMPQSIVACLPLLWLGGPPWAHVATGLAGAGLFTCILGTLGHVLSARSPRPLSTSHVGVASAPAALQLIRVALVLILSAATFGAIAGLQTVHVWAPSFAFGALIPVVLGLRKLALPGLAGELDACRESLCETLS
jgi:hypothetical protein